MQKLKAFIEPLETAWQDTQLNEAMASSEGFCTLLSLDKVRRYLISREVHKVQDWSKHALDDEGQALQRAMDETTKVVLLNLWLALFTDHSIQTLPLFPTKTFLASTTEKIVRDGFMHQACRSLWQGTLPIILPNLLKFLKYVRLQCSLCQVSNVYARLVMRTPFTIHLAGQIYLMP